MGILTILCQNNIFYYICLETYVIVQKLNLPLKNQRELLFGPEKVLLRKTVEA